MNDGIKALTEKFVADIVALVRRDVLDELGRNLGARQPAPLPRANGNGSSLALSVPSKFARRTRLELEQIGQQVVRQICDLPGLSIVDLSRRLKVRVRDVKQPLRELRGGGLIFTRGVKSGTRYYPAERQPSQ